MMVCTEDARSKKSQAARHHQVALELTQSSSQLLCISSAGPFGLCVPAIARLTRLVGFIEPDILPARFLTAPLTAHRSKRAKGKGKGKGGGAARRARAQQPPAFLNRPVQRPTFWACCIHVVSAQRIHTGLQLDQRAPPGSSSNRQPCVSSVELARI
jgi:hypothetical protein